jgi:FkbM family methyltransferase
MGGLLRLPLKLIPRTAVLPITSGPLRGSRWVVGSSVASCWLGWYEREKLAEMEEHIRPGDVVYDIGAQAGYHSLLSSRLVGEAGMVYAFEPLPRNYDFLVRHLDLNGVSNVRAVQAAMSDAEGELRFDPGPGFMAGHLSTEGSLRVQCSTVDNWASGPEIPAPSVMKIDVEGAEVKVLEGARETLRRSRPVVMIDTHDFLGVGYIGLHEQCCSLLRREQYKLQCTPSPGPRKAGSILAVPEPL